MSERELKSGPILNHATTGKIYYAFGIIMIIFIIFTLMTERRSPLQFLVSLYYGILKYSKNNPAEEGY